MTTPTSSPTLSGYGLAASLPRQWEGRIFQRPVTAEPQHLGRNVAGNHPVMHLANFALPPDRGDYGSGAVELMGPGQVFVALLQFGPDCLGSALFAPVGFPVLSAQSFNPNALQRRIAGQAGFQRFCTVDSRPLCVYVVLGAQRQAGALCPQINQVLQRIEVSS